MQLKELQLLFNEGALTKATITQATMKNGWYLQVKTKNGNDECYDSQREEVKTFSTLENAVKTAEKIGFKKIIIALHEHN